MRPSTDTYRRLIQILDKLRAEDSNSKGLINEPEQSGNAEEHTNNVGTEHGPTFPGVGNDTSGTGSGPVIAYNHSKSGASANPLDKAFIDAATRVNDQNFPERIGGGLMRAGKAVGGPLGELGRYNPWLGGLAGAALVGGTTLAAGRGLRWARNWQQGRPINQERHDDLSGRTALLAALAAGGGMTYLSSQLR